MGELTLLLFVEPTTIEGLIVLLLPLNQLLSVAIERGSLKVAHRKDRAKTNE